jgi:hypothetical protein
MKTKLLSVLVLFMAVSLSGQQVSSPEAKSYKLAVTNSFLQLFHPNTAVFAIGVEGKSDAGFAFYVEGGMPIKSSGFYNYNSEGKLDWSYYKTRLGGRYYFDPVKPYKYRRRYRDPQLKDYQNFVGIEGFVGAETFNRENGYYYDNNTFVNYSKATVVILSRSFIFTYGREFNLSDRFLARLYVGLGQRTTDTSHESVLIDSTTGSFGFFSFSGNAEYSEGVRRVPYVKIGFDIGIRMLKRR